MICHLLLGITCSDPLSIQIIPLTFPIYVLFAVIHPLEGEIKMTFQLLEKHVLLKYVILVNKLSFALWC